MNTEYYRDGEGRLVGQLSTDGDTSYFRDRSGRLEGIYKASSNSTFDNKGKLIGNSNQLLGLTEKDKNKK